MTRHFRFAIIAVAALLFSACGGGSSNSITPAPITGGGTNTGTGGTLGASQPAPTKFSVKEYASPENPTGGIAELNGYVYMNGADEFMRYAGGFTTYKYPLPVISGSTATSVTGIAGATSLALGPNSTVWGLQFAGFPGNVSEGAFGVLATSSGTVNETVEGSPFSSFNSDFFGTIATGPSDTMWLGHNYMQLGFQSGWADIYNASMQLTNEYPTPTCGSNCPVQGPFNAIVLGSDGDMYIATTPGAVSFQGDTPHPSSIARVDPATLTLLKTTTLPSASNVTQLAAGPDGAIWFTDTGLNKIGRITTGGAVTYYTVPTANAGLAGIAPGSDNALWFAETTGNTIGRISTTGSITEYPLSDSNAHPLGITAGPLGGCVPQTIYFTESTGLGVFSFSS